MDKYYLLGFGFIALAGIIYFIMKGKNESDEEIAKHLPKKKETSPSLNKNQPNNFISGADGNAKSGSLLDADNNQQNALTAKLAKWVDSEEYNEPEKVGASVLTSKPMVPKSEVSFDKPKILLVDDSLTVRTLLGKLLSKSGDFEVVLKENGVEAMDYLNGNFVRPDLVITDMQMPEMDGFELIDAIRAKSNLDGLRIIAISSVFEPEDHLELLELEKIQGFIKKQNPFDENDLMQQINYLIENN